MGLVLDFLEEFEPAWSMPRRALVPNQLRELDWRLFGPGVYVLMKQEVCVYVGGSKVLIQRIVQHRREGKYRFDKVLFFFCRASEVLAAEKAAVKKYRPFLNHGTGHGRQKFTLAELGVDLAKLIAENPAKVELKNGRSGLRRI